MYKRQAAHLLAQAQGGIKAVMQGQSESSQLSYSVMLPAGKRVVQRCFATSFVRVDPFAAQRYSYRGPQRLFIKGKTRRRRAKMVGVPIDALYAGV